MRQSSDSQFSRDVATAHEQIAQLKTVTVAYRQLAAVSWEAILESRELLRRISKLLGDDGGPAG